VIAPIAERFFERRFKLCLLLLFAVQLALFGLYTISQPIGDHPAIIPSSGLSLFVLFVRPTNASPLSLSLSVSLSLSLTLTLSLCCSCGYPSLRGASRPQCAASTFLGATTPLFFELGAEVTYPSNEGVSAGLISGMLNLGGLIILGPAPPGAIKRH
jgi:hypothetical protein